MGLRPRAREARARSSAIKCYFKVDGIRKVELSKLERQSKKRGETKSEHPVLRDKYSVKMNYYFHNSPLLP